MNESGNEALRWGIPLLLGVLWGQLFWALHPTWIHGQYYDYGWIVAPVTAWFFWRRWCADEISTPLVSGNQKGPIVLILLASAVLISGLILARIMERFDPIWRVPLILHGFLIFSFTVLTFWISLGRKKAFIYLPLLLFAMTAVPWPAQTENYLIGEMTARLLEISAPLSRLIGIPVELSGSALIANGRVIQIDEGCSGIRSFQSLLMAGLFVGEFMMLRNRFRIVLLVLAIVFGFVTNTLRAITLTWIFFNEGEAAFDQAHDMVGFCAFGLAAGLLLLSGHFLDRWSEIGPVEREEEAKSPEDDKTG